MGWSDDDFVEAWSKGSCASCGMECHVDDLVYCEKLGSDVCPDCVSNMPAIKKDKCHLCNNKVDVDEMVEHKDVLICRPCIQSLFRRIVDTCK